MCSKSITRNVIVFKFYKFILICYFIQPANRLYKADLMPHAFFAIQLLGVPDINLAVV